MHASTAHDGIVLPDRAADWVSVLYMAVVVGALGLLGQTWAQAHLPPTRSAIIMSMEPVFASFFAVWLGGEDLTTRLLLGGSMVLVAMLTVELAPRRVVEGEVPHIAGRIPRPSGEPRVGPSPYRGARGHVCGCGAELGVGRFCLNCGHRIGAPAPVRVEQAPAPSSPTVTATAPARERPVRPTRRRRRRPAPPPTSTALTPSADGTDRVPGPRRPARPGGRPHPGPADRPARRRTRRTGPSALAASDVGPRARTCCPTRRSTTSTATCRCSGLAWLGWVLGAALLVGLAFLLLRVFDTDGDEVATDPADAATGTSQAPDPGAEPTDGPGADGPTAAARHRPASARRST